MGDRFVFLVLVGLLAWGTADARVPVAEYGSIRESGQHYPRWVLNQATASPFKNAQGQLVDSVLDSTARFPVLVVEAGAARECRDILLALKERNPDQKHYWLVGAVVLSSYWQVVYFPQDTLTECLGLDFYRACSQVPDWWTRSKLCPGERYDPFRTDCGPRPNSWMGTNWASYPTVRRWVAIVVQKVIRDPMCDGLFVDLPHGSILWSQSPHDSIDFAGMGFRSIAAFDSAWRYNRTWAGRTLRRAAHIGFPIVMNGPYEPDRENGIAWMREGWPGQWGGSWDTNMFGWAGADIGGYVDDNVGSWINVLLCDHDGRPLPDRPRIMRFALGSAALAEGWACFSCMNDRPASDDRSLYRIPEMDVDPGDAWGPLYPWRGLWRRDFLFAYWLVNPSNVTVEGVPPRDARLVLR